MSSMTVKALLPSPRYTFHDATKSVLCNIRNLLLNRIFKAVTILLKPLEYCESMVSAGQCHSPYGTALNEHPMYCIPRATSLSV
jgi:hypothetical protein